MICEDWRNLPASTVAPLLDAEHSRWKQVLGWDTRTTWETVEEARASGRLPGLVLYDRGRIAGWTFYLLHGDVLQVGALVADEARGLRTLLDQVLLAPEAACAEKVSLFVLPDGGSLAPALTRRRFAMRRHVYLTLPLAGCTAPLPDPVNDAPDLRVFRGADEPFLVRLIAEAYRQQPSAECFAPHGRLDEWAWYVRQLLRTSTCGTLVPDATFVAPVRGRDALAGLVITTSISEESAHIAQIAVSPGARGTGLGSRLLAAAIARCRERGAERMTLMVSEDNASARALYAKFGFEAGPAFLYATRPLPRRLARAS